MPLQVTVTEESILQAALIGLQKQHDDYTAKMAEIRRRLGIRVPRTAQQTSSTAAPAKRRRMSAAARKRIAEAQRKRWAALKAEKNAQKKPGAKKSGAAAFQETFAMKKVAK